MGKKIYHCNDSFFKQDNEKSFYVAGFIAADGSIIKEKNRNRHLLSIELSKEDEQHLIKIRDTLSSNAKIENRVRVDSRFSSPTEQTMMRITSKEICLDLERFNIKSNKTLTYSIPKWLLTHPLKHHFIRGVFDGDGSISFKFSRKDTRKNYIRFSLCGTFEELDSINEVLCSECVIHPNKITQGKNCYYLEYAKAENVKKIVEYLYKDASIYLDRKYTLAKQVDNFI